MITLIKNLPVVSYAASFCKEVKFENSVVGVLEGLMSLIMLMMLVVISIPVQMMIRIGHLVCLSIYVNLLLEVHGRFCVFMPFGSDRAFERTIKLRLNNLNKLRELCGLGL